MTRPYRHAVLLLAAIVAAAVSLAGADDKPQPTLPIKLALDKTDPPLPTRLADDLRFHFCLTDGLVLDQNKQFTNKPGPCAKTELSVGANVDAIIAAFGKQTDYVLQKVDSYHLLLFCVTKEQRCDTVQTKRIEDTIANLAKPSPLAFADIQVREAIAQSIADKVSGKSDGRIKGSRIAADRLRLTTDSGLGELYVKDFLDWINKATTDSLISINDASAGTVAQRVDLSTFCVATTLDGPAPAVSDKAAKRCPDGTQEMVATNAAAIAVAISSDKVKAVADGPSRLVLSCNGAKCDDDLMKQLSETIAGLSYPSPAYLQDIPVLTNTARTGAAVVHQWNSDLSADVLSSNVIRLKSDKKLTTRDVAALQTRLLDAGFGDPQRSPVKQLFYVNPASVVAGLAGVTPANQTPLSPGSSPPSVTAGAATAAAIVSGSGVVALGDNVVFTGGLTDDMQRNRLLALLDLPRPEVLMNMWSLQSSSPSGRQLADESNLIRNAVTLHNEALQNAIDYGWAYLSRKMRDPQYFEPMFTEYLQKRFVADSDECLTNPGAAGCLTAQQRETWGICPAGKYCLGYSEAFRPLRPTLTNILLGIMASKTPFTTVFTAIGCMEGSYLTDGRECFPDRPEIAGILRTPLAADGQLKLDDQTDKDKRDCLRDARKKLMTEQPSSLGLSCEQLDRIGLRAMQHCQVAISLPLTCFTVQAAKSFVPHHGFSTFTLHDLNRLHSGSIAAVEPQLTNLDAQMSTTPLGLLRSSTVDFLFNYKMAQQFPQDFSPYLLTHSAQTLNAEFNPLVVAFNQDVAAFTRELMSTVQDQLHDSHWYTPWRGPNRSFVADGLVTVRGISGVESLVETLTQSAFDAPQYQSLPSFLSNLAGTKNAAAPTPATTTTDASGASTAITSPVQQQAGLDVSALLPRGLTAGSLGVSLAAAAAPTRATAQIGRQLTLDIVPHTLPGASSAELEVKLWAQEDSPPVLYKDGSGTSQTDPISRVAKHNVMTRVRVESVKLFEISSFSAMIQRPRAKFPLLPPFIEIPVISSVLGLPLPGAKVFHRSTAIVSAIIVPTASDLAFGIEFTADRAVVGSGPSLTLRRIQSPTQIPRLQQRLYQFHRAQSNCLATNGQAAIVSATATAASASVCNTLQFGSLPPDL